MRIPQLTNMSNDAREQRRATQAEVEAAKKAMEDDRAVAKSLVPDLEFDTTVEEMLARQLKRFAEDVPETKILYIPRPAQVRMQPEPEPLDNVAVHEMQLRESNAAGRIAEVVAEVVFGAVHLSNLHRNEYALCMSVATHAMRRLKLGWVKAAQTAAVDGCKRALREDCGTAFRFMPEAHLEAIARTLTGEIMASYFGVTEGTAGITPGEYIRVTKGEQ